MKRHRHQQKDEGFDVRIVHGQLLREKGVPREMIRAIPWWLKHLIYGPLLIWGLWYLLVASGGFRWNEYYEGVGSAVKMATDAAGAAETPDSEPPEP